MEHVNWDTSTTKNISVKVGGDRLDYLGFVHRHLNVNKSKQLEIILDLFMGSGSVCFYVDQISSYIDLNNLTGYQKELLEDLKKRSIAELEGRLKDGELYTNEAYLENLELTKGGDNPDGRNG